MPIAPDLVDEEQEVQQDPTVPYGSGGTAITGGLFLAGFLNAWGGNNYLGVPLILASGLSASNATNVAKQFSSTKQSSSCNSLMYSPDAKRMA